MRAVIEEQKDTVVPEIMQILHNKRIHEEMRAPKIDRPVAYHAKKVEGAHYGRLVKKVPESDIEKLDNQKYRNIWLEKTGHSGEHTSRIEDVFCEYIGTHLMREILGNERAAKLRLYVQNDDIKIMSKFIPDFETIKGSRSYNEREGILAIKGFARFFAANALIADYDLNYGNVGIRTIEGESFWARIDNDCALSYTVCNNNIFDKNFAVNFKKNMVDSSLYESALFNNFNFACELS